tara:strand:+ start:1091 stop:2530 length:1440 start_codon:yes stop_codon:yes gene_type:complete
MSWGGFAGGLAGALQKAEDRYQDKKEREEAREHAKSMQAASLAQAEKMYTIRRKDEWRDKIDATRKELGVYLGGMDDPRANHLMATLLPLGEAGTTVMKNYWDAAQRTGDNVLDLIDLQYKDGVDAENWGSFNIDGLISDLEHVKFGGDAKYTMKARKPSDLVKSYEFLHMPDEEDFGSSFEAVQTSTSQYMIKNQIRLEKMEKAGKKGSVAYNRIKERIDFAKRVQKQNLLNQAAIDGSSDTLDYEATASWKNSFRMDYKTGFESMVVNIGLGQGHGDQFKAEWQGKEDQLIGPYSTFIEKQFKALQQFKPENTDGRIKTNAIYNLGVAELNKQLSAFNGLFKKRISKAVEYTAGLERYTEDDLQRGSIPQGMQVGDIIDQTPHTDKIINIDKQLFQKAYNSVRANPNAPNFQALYQKELNNQLRSLLNPSAPEIVEGTVLQHNGMLKIFKGIDSSAKSQTNILGLTFHMGIPDFEYE